MNRLFIVRLFSCNLVIASFALAGCQKPDKPAVPSNSVASSAESVAKTEPTLEATTVKVEVDGQSLVQLTSFIDDFQITLPLDFRGTILTDREIAAFSGRIKSDVPQLATQIQSQCNALRPSGGVVFAMNMRPASVTDGFADNMNVSIRGVQETLTLKAVKDLVVKELSDQKPGVKIAVSEIDSEAGKMLEFQFAYEEGPAKTNVSRFVYSTIRKQQIFTIAYASSKLRAPKVVDAFRNSARSLSYL